MIRRCHILVLICGSVFFGAVALRVYSYHTRFRPELLPAPAASSEPPAPPDYVAHPRVVPEEASAGPRRIISLAPSITEVICSLGLADRLVGRTEYCVYPPQVASVPAVGALINPNYEKIRSLSPDVVLITSNSHDLIAGLRRLGIPYATVPHETLDDVYRSIVEVGRVCGRPRTAAQLVASIRADMDGLRHTAAALNLPRRRVLVVLGELPVPAQTLFVAGPGSFLEALLEAAGQVNAARGVARRSYGELPLERLRLVDPEVILEFRSEESASAMQSVYEAWSRVGPLQAIRLQRVRSVGGPEWLSAGPRIAIELHRFISALSQVR